MTILNDRRRVKKRFYAFMLKIGLVVKISDFLLGILQAIPYIFYLTSLRQQERVEKRQDSYG